MLNVFCRLISCRVEESVFAIGTGWFVCSSLRLQEFVDGIGSMMDATLTSLMLLLGTLSLLHLDIASFGP